MGRERVPRSQRPRRILRENLDSKFKPIADYGLIGDTKSCALVGIDGSIDWFCVPRFDSPSVFGAILDIKKGGRFRICPDSSSFFSSQYYEKNTNILITDFQNKTGKASLVDFMPCFKLGKRIVGSGEIHRIIRCTSGEINIEVSMQPRFNYGSIVPRVEHVHPAGYSFISDKGSQSRQELSLLTSLELKERKGSHDATISMKSGESTVLVARYGARLFNLENPHTEIKLKETRKYWRRWASQCKYDGKWRDMILRSALALKLLVFSPTGAIVAAPTTSLPEELGGVRNWDYRFSWIRDSSFAMWAFQSLGHREEVRSYISWLSSILCLTNGNLQIMLGIGGETDLTEYTIPSLRGFMGSKPVRVGNAASNQFQLDVYGILLDAMYFSFNHSRRMQKREYNYVLRPVVEGLERVWQRPDSGIWEVRSDQENFVYSKMWSWVAADRAVRIAVQMNELEDVARWSKLRDEIRNDVYSKGYDKSIRSFVRSYGSKELDSANLLMPQVHFISAKNPMMKSTIRATMKTLMVGGRYLYRYLADDGLPGREGAFLICSFWLAQCLALSGHIKKAERMMDSLVKDANHLGLFSEEINPKNGTLLGNFPQTFTHMGFITAATSLGRAISGNTKNTR
jgi:alpha,alpha-trehalase